MYSLEDTRGLLQEAVMTQGRTFRYQPVDGGTIGGECYYWPIPDGPESKRITGCLIGVVLNIIHYPIYRQNCSVRALENIREYFTSDALQYLSVAQEIQDFSGTWGDAFDAAEGWAGL